MPDGGALINFGEISKPMTVLVEKVSDAVGGIAKPWQIKRVARAEAQAEIIRAKARLVTTDLERRAVTRLIREEAQKQKNIESITAKALPKLEQNAQPDQIEKDWLSHLFDRARHISDSEMQSMWAGILAGEANSPGSFSKKTVELAASLDKADAQLFAKLCTFCWDIEGLVPLILSERGIYEEIGIGFDALRHLDSIGLIDSTGFGYERRELPTECTTSYFGTKVVIFPANGQLRLGSVLFTRAGEQLAKICQAERSERYFEYVVQQWFDYRLSPWMPMQRPVTDSNSVSA